MDKVLNEVVVEEVVQKKDSVQELFKQGKLLARVVRQPNYTKTGIDVEFWQGEIDSMKQKGGMEHTSTTLITEGKGIDLYEFAYGFLFNSDQVVVEHVSLTDSGSGGNKDGTLRANPPDFDNLEQMRNYYRDSDEGSFTMNEVNATVTNDSVVGVVIRKGVKKASTLLEFALFAKTLSENGIEVPVYEYDEHQGRIRALDLPPTQDLIDGTHKEFVPLFRKAFEN